MNSDYENVPEMSRLSSILIALCVGASVLSLVGIKILLTAM
jgi:hypothetical protein